MKFIMVYVHIMAAEIATPLARRKTRGQAPRDDRCRDEGAGGKCDDEAR